MKCHFSKFVWIRGLKAKTADEAANELSKWLNNNGYISILACNNGGEFKGKVIEVYKQRGIKIIRGRAYYPQSQGSIKVANRIFKKRLRAARADTGIQSWIQLLPLIAWVINTTATGALPKGNTPYEVWFGRKPPTDFPNHKESASREVESDENSSSEGGEDSLFVDEEAEQEEGEAEEMILSELTKRVAEHTRKQRENMVKRTNSKALEYDIQEIATLQIPKQYRFGTEMARIPVRVLEKGLKICVSEYTLNKS